MSAGPAPNPDYPGAATSSSALLAISDLRVGFATEDGLVQAVDGVSLSLDRGEVLGVVGESGSGKSVTALTIMGLTHAANAQIDGAIEFCGSNLLERSYDELRPLRGDEIAMIFQDPLSSLHPLFTIGAQIVETIRAHRKVPKAQARAHAEELLGLVDIPSPARRLDSYPHELSGGMRQRAMIAMALANEPRLLIADEPTTALDVTVQAQILRLIARLRDELGMAVLLITHDLGVIAEIADRAVVMYAGRVVEQGSVEAIFYDPQHPYTWGLLGSVTRPDRPKTARLPSLGGQPPSLIAPPQGCHFRPRCRFEFESCVEPPPLVDRVGGDGSHLDRCWLDPQRKRALRAGSDRTRPPGAGDE